MTKAHAFRLLSDFGFWPFVADVLAFGAVLSALVSGLSVVTTALLVLALVVVVVRQWGALGRAYRDVAPVGSFMVGRFVALSAAVGAAAVEGSVSPVFWVLAGAVAVALACEPMVRVLSQRAQPRVRNLPGIEDRADAGFGYGLVFVLNTAVIVLAYVASAGLLWVLVVFAVAVAAAWVLVLAAVLDGAIKTRARQASERDMYRRLSELKPTFALHWHGPKNSVHQVKMWLPYLDRLGMPYFIITRTWANFSDLRKITDRPIVLRPKVEEVDDVVVPSLRTVFYVNNARRNAHVVRFIHLTHVQLNHGDSDKAPSFNPVFKKYDKNFVAGQAAIDRFADNGVTTPDDFFSIVGRPQVENVQVATQPISNVTEPTVLYAPTWSGFYTETDYSSLPLGHKIVSELLARGCTVIFRPHPNSYEASDSTADCERVQGLLAEDARVSGRKHVYGDVAERQMSVYDCFNASDAMIADVSSVVGDYLFSEKPFATVAVSSPVADFRDEFPMSRAGYIINAHDGSLCGLDSVLNELLGNDSLHDTRRGYKTYYLGDIPNENYAQRFIDEARAAINRAEGAEATS